MNSVPIRANFFGRTFDLVSESNLLLLTLLALAIRCHAYSSVYTSTVPLTLCCSERFSARSAVLVYQLCVQLVLLVKELLATSGKRVA